MSLSNDTGGAVMTMPVQPAYNGGCGGMGWGGDWASWIILFLIFGMYGYGGFGNGFGGFGGGAGLNGAMTRNDLCGEFSFQDVKNGIRNNGDALAAGFRNIDNAVCTLGYNQAQLANGIQMQIANEGRGIDNAVCTLGYQTQLGFNGLGAQLADCCCKTQTAIGEAKTQTILNTNALQAQLAQCCCDAQKDTMQTRFDMAQGNCATLQAIDKVGDRIIDYLCNEKAQALRDENQALRLAASQTAQNQYLIGQLRPCPIPAYPTCNPWAGSGYGGCGCAA